MMDERAGGGEPVMRAVGFAAMGKICGSAARPKLAPGQHLALLQRSARSCYSLSRHLPGARCLLAGVCHLTGDFWWRRAGARSGPPADDREG